MFHLVSHFLGRSRCSSYKYEHGSVGKHKVNVCDFPELIIYMYSPSTCTFMCLFSFFNILIYMNGSLEILHAGPLSFWILHIFIDDPTKGWMIRTCFWKIILTVQPISKGHIQWIPTHLGKQFHCHLRLFTNDKKWRHLFFLSQHLAVQPWARKSERKSQAGQEKPRQCEAPSSSGTESRTADGNL